VVNDVPKSMAPINGKPFLEYQFDYLDVFGVERIILSVGYLHEKIIDHYGYQYKDIKLDYAIEKEALGTGGGLKLAMALAHGPLVYVLNGDTFYEVDYKRLLDMHRSNEAKLSIVLREVDEVSRYGCVERDEKRRISGFWEKGQKSGKGFINGGIYIINKRFFDSQDLPDKFSLEKDFFEKIYKKEKIYGLLCRQYFIDIGIPEDYAKAQDDFKDFEYL
jgi:D-glycero-alpha-D-manno-heptose 1-phosphate guanylyltransferase